MTEIFTQEFDFV